MLCGGARPDPAALHPGLAAVLARVETYCRKRSRSKVPVATIAFIVVAWEDTYPNELPYKRK